MKAIALALLISGIGLAQNTPAPEKNPGPRASSTEEQELSTALGEAGSSPIEMIRALERHLEKYPETAKRAEIERALVKGAIETRDDRRTILYGERVLARDPDDIQVLDRVTRALLTSDAKDTSERALKYARHYQELIAKLHQQGPPGGYSAAQWKEELDRGTGRAIVLEARATGNLGKTGEAAALARKAWDLFPTAESARETGRWLAREGKDEEAIRHYADAFTVADARTTDEARAKDRLAMGDLYRKAHGSEKGLGDLILEAYDRTAALLAVRKLRLKTADPNSGATGILDFTISDLEGKKLALASLKGKAIVFDFWATWCGPCRIQHPLYEEVKKRFHDAGDVVFLSIDTDEERNLVPQFLKDQKWSGPVYYEDGLVRMLQVSSIPTTVVVDRRGEVISRLNGFVPQRFVDMLTDRIHDALKSEPPR